ncbi:hypothetical protein [Mycoplasma sp. SG1]|uniref:hypothetical protein n=1 Tax=Mycoplasma sp. SG1 TaxID=2810348 RepID=UPI0020246539|nr:hypothetical protein [Mycoplasma sp. SG1]URM52967.1 hypothetical protein JRW51_01315 [Mycoplasma sp. SG1]
MKKVLTILWNKKGVFNYILFFIFFLLGLLIAFFVIYFLYNKNDNMFQLLGFSAGYFLFLAFLSLIEASANKVLKLARKSVVTAKKTYLLSLLGRYVLLIAFLIVFIIFRQYFRLIGLASGIAVCLILGIILIIIKYVIAQDEIENDTPNDIKETAVDYDLEYQKLLKDLEEENKHKTPSVLKKDQNKKITL